MSKLVIGQHWVALDREHAGPALIELIEQLEQLAEQSQDSNEYQHLTNTARSLLTPLRETAPESAEALLAGWPDPAEIAGSPHSPDSLEMMRKEHFQWLVRRDPDLALERLKSLEGESDRR